LGSGSETEGSLGLVRKIEAVAVGSMHTYLVSVCLIGVVRSMREVFALDKGDRDIAELEESL
jgi:hypothetical protein